MALVRGSNDHYWWDVKHKVPLDKGKFLTVGFTAKFRRLDKERVSDILSRIHDPDDTVTDAEVVTEVLSGWRDVKEMELEDGSAPDYGDDDQRDWVLGIVGMEGAVVRAWIDSITGGARKN